MNMDALEVRKSSKKPLVQAERQVLISKMLDFMTEGYYSTSLLAKKCKVARGTIEKYRPMVDEIISRQKIDRNAIRVLQIRRTYELIEQMIEDLRQCVGIKERALIYNQIYKMSSHLSLITGLNVETTVHVDPTKLVIIRANPNKKEVQANITEVDANTVAGVTEVA